MNPPELKFCVDCIHHTTDEYGIHFCLRAVKFEQDLVTGVKHGIGPRYNANEERKPSHKDKWEATRCGKVGKFFSPREVKEENPNA